MNEAQEAKATCPGCGSQLTIGKVWTSCDSCEFTQTTHGFEQDEFMAKKEEMCNGIEFFLEESKKEVEPGKPAMELRVKIGQLFRMAEMPRCAKKIFQEALDLVDEIEKESLK